MFRVSGISHSWTLMPMAFVDKMTSLRNILFPLLSVVLLLMATASCRQKGNGRPQAVIEFADTVLDLGEVALSDTLRFSYHYTNSGDAGLLLWGVQPDCGSCTHVAYSTDTIAPGESGEIAVTFNGANKYGLGPHDFYIHVRTNTEKQYNDLLFTTYFSSL